ncbi:hypothetical protein CTYAZ2_11670 [Comamonas testosteroni]|nr:hypothetical protein CTYAZ2_11670 [Comamonas testosteroni]
MIHEKSPAPVQTGRGFFIAGPPQDENAGAAATRSGQAWGAISHGSRDQATLIVFWALSVCPCSSFHCIFSSPLSRATKVNSI